MEVTHSGLSTHPALLAEDLLQGRHEWHNIQTVVRLAINTLIHEIESSSEAHLKLAQEVQTKADLRDLRALQTDVAGKATLVEAEGMNAKLEEHLTQFLMERLREMELLLQSKADQATVQSELLLKASGAEVEMSLAREREERERGKEQLWVRAEASLARGIASLATDCDAKLAGVTKELQATMDVEMKDTKDQIEEAKREVRAQVETDFDAKLQGLERAVKAEVGAVESAVVAGMGEVDKKMEAMEREVSQTFQQVHQDMGAMQRQSSDLAEVQVRIADEMSEMRERLSLDIRNLESRLLEERERADKLEKQMFTKQMAKELREEIKADKVEREKWQKSVTESHKTLKAGLEAHRLETHRALDLAADTIAKARGETSTMFQKLKVSLQGVHAEVKKERVERGEAETRLAHAIQQSTAQAQQTTQESVRVAMEEVEKRCAPLAEAAEKVKDLTQQQNQAQAQMEEIAKTGKDVGSEMEGVKSELQERMIQLERSIESTAVHADRALERSHKSLTDAVERVGKVAEADCRGVSRHCEEVAAELASKMSHLADVQERHKRDADQAMQARPTFQDLDSCLRARPTFEDLDKATAASRMHFEADLATLQVALPAELERRLSQLATREAVERGLAVKCDSEELRAALKSRDHAVEVLAREVERGLQDERDARKETSAKLSREVVELEHRVGSGLLAESKERAEGNELLHREVRRVLEEVAAANSAEKTERRQAVEDHAKLITQLQSEISQAEGQLGCVIREVGDQRDRLDNVLNKTIQVGEHAEARLQEHKQETSSNFTQSRSELKKDLEAVVAVAQRASEEAERWHEELSRETRGQVREAAQQLQITEDRLRGEALDLVKAARAELGVKLDRKAEVHDVMGRHANITEALSRKLNQADMEAYTHPKSRVDEQQTQLASLRASLDALSANLASEIKECRVDGESGLKAVRAEAEEERNRRVDAERDLSNQAQQDLHTLDTNLRQLAQEIQGEVLEVDGRLSATHSQLLQQWERTAGSLNQVSAKGVEVAEQVEKLAEVVRADRISVKETQAQHVGALKGVEGTLQRQWEETCRGLDMAADVARQAQTEAESVGTQLRGAMVSVQDSLNQERVERLELVTPIREQVQQAQAQIEAQRERMQRGLDAAADLSQKLQQAQETQAQELRDEVHLERVGRTEALRSLQQELHTVGSQAEDSTQHVHRLIDSLTSTLNHVTTELENTKSRLKKLDSLELEYQSAVRKFSQRTEYLAEMANL